jgi:deoxyribose-phosphate aldolase
VLLLRANVSKEIKVKASGGISGLKDGEDFINAGADRLGTSRIIKAVKEGAK